MSSPSRIHYNVAFVACDLNSESEEARGPATGVPCEPLYTAELSLSSSSTHPCTAQPTVIPRSAFGHKCPAMYKLMLLPPHPEEVVFPLYSLPERE